MIAESISEKTGVEINKRQVFSQPLRTLGEHTVEIRLTVDLIPEVTVVVNQEGEEPEEVIIQEPVRPDSEEDQEEGETREPAELVSEVEELEIEDLEVKEETETTAEEDELEVEEESETFDEVEEIEEELESAVEEEIAE
jgi:hypothetical protein